MILVLVYFCQNCKFTPGINLGKKVTGIRPITISNNTSIRKYDQQVLVLSGLKTVVDGDINITFFLHPDEKAPVFCSDTTSGVS